MEWAPDQKIATEIEWSWTATGAAAAAILTTPFVGLEAQSLAGGYKGNGVNVTLDVSTFPDEYDANDWIADEIYLLREFRTCT